MRRPGAQELSEGIVIGLTPAWHVPVGLGGHSARLCAPSPPHSTPASLAVAVIKATRVGVESTQFSKMENRRHVYSRGGGGAEGVKGN